MRQTAARLNRTWLVVTGLLLVLAGVAVLVVASGLLAPLARAAGLSVTRPRAGDPVVGRALTSAVGVEWAIVVAAVVGVVLAFLALAWLLAQVPRRNPAKPFRLQDSAATGLTRCAPDVLTDAVAAQVAALPDVADASAVLRGTATEPDLTIKVTATDRADVPALLETLRTTVSRDLGTALDTKVRRLAVQVEIGSHHRQGHQIALDPRRAAGLSSDAARTLQA